MAISYHLDRPVRAGRRSDRAEAPGRAADLTRAELLGLLNDDFARECQGVYAYAVYAERFRDANPAAAAACEARGHQEVAHALAVCQLLYDCGGAVTARVDDREAVRRADRVAGPRWSGETVRRLRERAEQLRAAGQADLADRAAALAEQKERAGDLAGIVGRHGVG